MSEEPKKEKITKVKFLYIKPEKYEPVYVNGLFGGMTPRGELLCNFFYEHHDVPEEEHYDVEDGKLKTDKTIQIQRVKPKPSEVIYRRDLRVALIIPAHQVSNMANWMLDKLKSSGIVVEKEEE